MEENWTQVQINVIVLGSIRKKNDSLIGILLRQDLEDITRYKAFEMDIKIEVGGFS